MAKDSYYFQHDFNARNDRKIAALVKKHKSAGYGIFWITCEMMHEEGGSIEFDDITFGAIAKDANEELELVKIILTDCVSEFKLFILSGDIAKSNRVSRNLDRREEISKIRSNSGKLGANAKQNQANAQQTASKGKEIKGKENNNKNIPDDDFGAAAPKTPPNSIFYPKAKDFNGLPERVTIDLVTMVLRVKQVEIASEDVLAIWEVFKNHNLTGEKEYKDEGDVYRHFVNWGMKQSFRKKSKPKEKSNIASGENVGVEFINDFAQCRMKNGVIVDLNRNQIDSARYGQIKPSSIKN